MKLKTFKLITTIFTALSITILSTPVFADAPCPSICGCDSVPLEFQAAAGCEGASSQNDLQNSIQIILNSIIGALGTTAVVFIVIGGVQYITSSGDSAKTKKAKDTILYACIGLAICAIAFAITNFAIDIIGKSN